jgi:hypothetical protein
VTHAEFLDGYTHGKVKVEMDPIKAARFMSQRLMLPFIAMPVAGLGVALALTGWIYTGCAVMALAYLVPRFIKRSASHFVFQHALHDPRIYYDAVQAEALRVTSAKDEG